MNTHKRFSGDRTDITSVSYNPSRDKNLSARAKGVLYYLLLKPIGWEGRTYDIVQHFADTSYSIKQGIKELVEAGYMRRVPIRNNGTFVGSRYEFSDQPRFKK